MMWLSAKVTVTRLPAPSAVVPWGVLIVPWLLTLLPIRATKPPCCAVIWPWLTMLPMPLPAKVCVALSKLASSMSKVDATNAPTLTWAF